MPDWKTRLAVSFRDQDGNEQIISPIDSFNPTFALNAEVLHSLEDTHIGVVYSPESMSFSLTVKAIGGVAAKLTALALQAKRFDIILQEADEGTDWAFNTIVMKECVITSATPTTPTISGSPTATFSGFSLAASAEPKTGAALRVPR
jgi:hypothetical protein